ncbi:MAG: 1-deoxy-D-xylulose-5-phosphate reductoisomerase [Candidatus Omnitrophota bacterium]
MKQIVVLGSTGSVGRSALAVIKSHPDRYAVRALAANTNLKLLAEQARAFGVRDVAIGDKSCCGRLKRLLPSGVRVHAGVEGISYLAAESHADIILMAIGGTQAIVPLVDAVRRGRRVALASKEALVSAGAVITRLAAKTGSVIIPVDSEHSAIFQCLNGENPRSVSKIYLTGSGGPLRKVKKSIFDRLPLARVIKHPKWKMGRKITIDSATMMNKGLELIEAKWLFSVPTKMIEVLLHPEAIIHSMVEFTDGIVMANMFSPDMRFPIAYAFGYPGRLPDRSLPRLDFCAVKNLTFEKPDLRKFPALKLAYRVSESESACAVLNAANEEAVRAYLDGRIKLTSMVDIVEKVLRLHRPVDKPSLKQILALDAWAKEEARRLY